jgi:hypothetical protein
MRSPIASLNRSMRRSSVESVRTTRVVTPASKKSAKKLR